MLVPSHISLATTKPCRPISAAMRCPIRAPSRQSRLPDETLGEMREVRKDGWRENTCSSWRGRKTRVGNRRRKTMRQNQKINEALFQWQDLCTVNITLAIRGNPITLRLSSPLLSLWEGENKVSKRVKDEKKMDTERENTSAWFIQFPTHI